MALTREDWEGDKVKAIQEDGTAGWKWSSLGSVSEEPGVDPWTDGECDLRGRQWAGDVGWGEDTEGF